MNIWDERYSGDTFVYGTEPNSFVKEHANIFLPGKILCLAEGEGRNAVYLAQQGYEVVAVDASQVGLQKAQKLAAKNNVKIETITADLAKFIIPENSYSGIVSIYCHLAPDIREKVHKAAVKGLKSGGIMLLEAYTPEQLNYQSGGPSNVNLMMNVSTVSNEFCGLQTKHLQECIIDRVEGLGHTGKAAVVQFIAKK